MKDKLTEYINTIFADAERSHPGHRKLAELKEEMRQNLHEKYDDLIATGKSPAAAYNIAVSSIGDITELLDSVCGTTATEAPNAQPTHAVPPSSHRALTPEETERLDRYRRESALRTSVAIAFYILCVVPCILLGSSPIGPVLMFLMVAAATALLIFNGMSKPKFVRDADGDNDDDDDRDDRDDEEGMVDGSRPRRSPVYAALSGALWVLTVCVYLLVSFLSGQWQITWMIFLIAVAADNIMKAIFDLRR